MLQCSTYLHEEIVQGWDSSTYDLRRYGFKDPHPDMDQNSGLLIPWIQNCIPNIYSEPDERQIIDSY